jgi:hypothetical protein
VRALPIATAVAWAGNPVAADTAGCELTHLRILDARTEGARSLAARHSPTFRALVDAVQHSDLITDVARETGHQTMRELTPGWTPAGESK